MNLKQLEAFVEVAERGSFSKAAVSLHLTQPTISAHIHSLEKELKAKLLIRNTKEVSLSGEGEILYGYAKKMVGLENAIYQKFHLKSEKSSSTITLGASSIPAQYILPQVMTKFCRKYPNEQFKITEGDSAEVVHMLVNHKIEIGFTGTMLSNPYCEYIPVYKDKLVIIAPNSEKYNGIKKGFPVELLQEEQLIMREEGSGTRKEAEKYMKRSGIKLESLNVVASMSNQEAIKKSVSSGMGISVISELAAKDYVNDGRVLAFDLSDKTIYRHIYLVKNKERQMSYSTGRFMEYAQEYFKKKYTAEAV